jgi:hypothetical protein
MNSNAPVSKVLVLDDSSIHARALKIFCDEHSLVALKVRAHRLFSVLRSNIDLGAILLSETYGGSTDECAQIAIRINAILPELPIILRRESEPSTVDLADEFRHVICTAYIAADMAPLKAAIDNYIFSFEYPNALVRGILEMTESMLNGLFTGVSIVWDTPCIVRDQIIFGEAFSLIPLESAWCRGYMMMQAEEAPILALLDQQRLFDGPADFRDLNSLLGEMTNLVWGSFKNRYLGNADELSRSQVQVPLLINHLHKYISFGTSNPQLCFVYRVIDQVSGHTVTLHQRFIFNLSWLPEDFSEVELQMGDVIAAGELDLF